jgi:hypothetical protein
MKLKYRLYLILSLLYILFNTQCAFINNRSFFRGNAEEEYYRTPIARPESSLAFTKADQEYLYRRVKKAAEIIPLNILNKDLVIEDYRDSEEHHNLKNKLLVMVDNKNAWPEYIYIARLCQDNKKYQYIISSSDIMENHDPGDYDISAGMKLAMEKNIPVVTDFSRESKSNTPAVYYPLRYKNKFAGFLVFVKHSWRNKARRVKAIYNSKEEETEARIGRLEIITEDLEKKIKRLSKKKYSHQQKRQTQPTKELKSAIKDKNLLKLNYGNGIMDKKQSLGGSGHAIYFERPEGDFTIKYVEVLGSRYGYARTPDENFLIYILDEKMKILHEKEYPYNSFKRGDMSWVALEMDSIQVPEKFWIVLNFNAGRTKGIYVGKEKTASPGHSLKGTPEKGFSEKKENFEWMIRTYLEKIKN